MPARVCWSCYRQFTTTTADATLHRYVDYTFTVTYPHRDCGCQNEEPISGVDLEYLIACGRPIREPDPVSVVFADELDDPELTAAYMNLWARQ